MIIREPPELYALGRQLGNVELVYGYANGVTAQQSCLRHCRLCHLAAQRPDNEF